MHYLAKKQHVGAGYTYTIVALLLIYLFALAVTLLVALTLFHGIWGSPHHPEFRVLQQKIQKTFHFRRSDASQLRRFKNLGYDVVLFSGTATSPADADSFLHSAQVVAAERPRTVFVVTGVGDTANTMAEHARELSLGNKVCFIKSLPDTLRSIYESADLFVIPSVPDQSHTVLEAMHVGVPIVISNTSPSACMTNTIVRVDFQDTGKFARHLSTLLAEPLRREALSRRARTEAKLFAV